MRRSSCSEVGREKVNMNMSPISGSNRKRTRLGWHQINAESSGAERVGGAVRCRVASQLLRGKPQSS